jgi:outer membrane protein assembly factor BamA
VRRVQIQGNQHFSEGTLKKQIRTSRNRRILGVPGLTWWRWVYRLGDADWMWGRLGRALKSGGEPPAYLDSTTVAGDVNRLQLYYEQQGFFDAQVQSSIRLSAAGTRATVTFRVEPGHARHLRRVTYEGLDALTATQRREIGRETVLDPVAWRAETPLSFRADGQRYQKPLLLDERRRLLSYLQNQGYAAITRDSIRAIVNANTTPPGSLDVTFRVRMGPRYRFGDVNFRITGPEEAPPRRDTLAVPTDSTEGLRPLVTSHIEDESQLGTGLLRRSLQFAPGTTYDQSRVRATKQRLEGANLFTFTSLTPQFDRATQVDSARYLPLRIEAQTQRRHRLRLETFGLQRGPEIDFGSNEFGLGLGGVYENANALGGGETFRLRASGSVATSLDSTLFTSTQFEGTASLTLPYLIRPFGQFERVFDLANAQTQISLSALTARRNELRLRIRSRNSARLRLEMNHTPTRASLVDVIDVSISNPDTLSGFRNRFLDTLFVGIEDPVQRAQILEDYTQPQVNTALRYTFRSATANPLRRREGHIYELSGEVGNTLPLLFDRFIFAPDTLDYSLPGLTGRSGGGLSGSLLFRPYVRGTVDLRRYVYLGPGSTLALKVFGGMAHPTAGPTLVPFDRRFFSGGASSVRGWRLRQLGPGGAGPPDTTGRGLGNITGILGGDIKVETSVELRTTLLRNILAANWIGATFLDVGNVWFGPRNQGFGRVPDGGDGEPAPPALPADRNGRLRNVSSLSEVGVGSGVGLRIEWEYLIVRFDLAYRLHDPSPQNDDVFSDTYTGPLLHFGIGQAF